MIWRNFPEKFDNPDKEVNSSFFHVDNGGDIEIAELKKAYGYLNSQEGFNPISDEKIDEILEKVD